MKANVKKFILIAFEAVFIFALVFCLNINTLKTKRYAVAGIEPIYQVLYKPVNTANLEELDEVLQSEYAFYEGYHYYGATTTCTNSINNKESILYMVGEGLNTNLHFTVTEGEFFEFSDSYEVLPVVLGGNYYKGLDVGDRLDINIKAIDEGKQSVNVNAVVVGKIDVMDYRYPESISYQDRGDIVNNGIALCPDVYLKDVANLDNKDVVLDYNASDSTFSNDSFKEMKAEAQKYGIFSLEQSLYDFSLYTFFSDLDYLYIIIAIAILNIAMINIYLIREYLYNQQKGRLIFFPIIKLISVIIFTAFILTYNFSGGVINAFQISFYCIPLIVVFHMAVTGVFLLLVLKKSRMKKLINMGEKYEKI